MKLSLGCHCQSNNIVITGDLNLHRLWPYQRKGKIIRDFEDVHGLEFLVTKPTRITNTTDHLHLRLLLCASVT